MVTQVTSFSRNGVSDWLVQRFTAVLLALYTVVLVGYVLMQPEFNYQDWKWLFSQQWMQIFTAMAILSICAHAWIGMWTAGTDYLRVHTMGAGANTIRVIYQMACTLILLVYAIWGFNILWGI